MIRDNDTNNTFLARIRQWVESVAIPNEDRVASLNEVPQDLVNDMQKSGFFGWSIPEQYGGAGLTTEELVLAAFELSYCSVAFRARVGSNTGIGSESLIVDGTDMQRMLTFPSWQPVRLSGVLPSRKKRLDRKPLLSKQQQFAMTTVLF